MILDAVRNTIKSKNMIDKGDRLLLCVSGGPDSVTLFYTMLSLRKEYDFKCFVAHLNHMLRGRESASDERLVSNLAAEYGIPCIIENRDVKKIAKDTGMTIEESAREARYDFFQSAAKKFNANKIVTAHNLDDQAETVIMRAIKGAGSLGLSGIPYVRRSGKCWIIRPMLDVKRGDIENYIKKENICYRHDKSNFKTKFTRNKIRHVLLPLIENEFNPRIKKTLSNIAKTLTDELDYINREAMRILRNKAFQKGDVVSMPIKSLKKIHLALLRILSRRIINNLKGDLKKISFRHLEEIEAVVNERKSVVQLPGKIVVYRKGRNIIFSKSDVSIRPVQKIKKKLRLYVPGRLIIKDCGFVIEADISKSRPRFKKGYKKAVSEYVDGSNLKTPLVVRSWKAGDRMRPLGMRSFKKLHDIFVDEKIERRERGKIPIILSGKTIVWAGGVKLSDDFRIGRHSKKIIRLSIHKIC